MFSSSWTRHRLSGLARLEIGDRQAEQMMKEFCAERDIDAAGRVRGDIGAQPGEQHLEQRDGGEPDHQHFECRQAVVNQNLVDHQLEENRRDQSKQLHEK
jgi:hypothetical protein